MSIHTYVMIFKKNYIHKYNVGKVHDRFENNRSEWHKPLEICSEKYTNNKL